MDKWLGLQEKTIFYHDTIYNTYFFQEKPKMSLEENSGFRQV